MDMQSRVPQIKWNEDLAIVVVSAAFTIACIPAALVWFFASRFARWMIVGMAVLRLFGLPGMVEAMQNGQSDQVWPVIAVILTLAAARLLFTRQAAHWFRFKGRGDVESFR